MKGVLSKLPWLDGLLLVGVVMVVIGVGMSFKKQTSVSSNSSIGKNVAGVMISVVPTRAAKEVVVEVAGAVKKQGVYHLASGSRVIDALTIAGGIDEKKAEVPMIEKNINKAQILVDEMKIYIPFKGESVLVDPQGGPFGKVSSDKTVKININKASASELEALPGVGPAMAERIINFREKIGGYKQIEDLLKVSGIGEKTLEKFRDYVEL